MNPQKIPVRSMIVAEPDSWLVNFDLSQAETWVVAFLANEPNMKHALQFADIHRQTAQHALFKYTDDAWSLLTKDEAKSARYIGKRFNHATAYRMGPYRATEVINKDSDKPPFVTVTHAESKTFYLAWHDYYSIKGWWSEIEWNLNKTRTLKTPYGRLRYFFDPIGEELYKKATAFLPQSTVAEHMDGRVQKELGIRGGLLEVYRQFVKPGHIKVIGQAHDSALCNIPKKIASDVIPQIHKLLLRPLVANGEEFTIPVDCEIGERWGELKEQKREVGKYEIAFEGL